MADTLTDRSQKILEAIIEEYIATAQPVGSKALAQSLGIKLSPASVRNVMAELEELGYLKGFYDARMVGDFAVRERHYEITVAGIRAYHSAHAFYSNGVAAIGT